MESNGSTAFHASECEANVAFVGVATSASLAVQPSALADMQASISAADSFTFAAASLNPAAMQMNNAVPDMTCAIASDEPPACSELLRPSATAEKLPVSDKPLWRPHSELLPPARLVEVAHAALQSSGFRRRLATGTQQPSQHDTQNTQPAPASSAAAEVNRTSAAKRELPGDNCCDSDRPHGMKRLRNESCGETAPFMDTMERAAMDGPIDAAARIVNVTPLLTLPPLVPTVKREAPAPAILSNASSITPFSVSLPGQLSGSMDGIMAPSADTAFAAVNGPLKSAFSQAASLPTEWQPGCSITTGRRSARSPAPKGSRKLSLVRATSAEANSGPLSHRCSGLGATAFSHGPAEHAFGGTPGGSAAAAPSGAFGHEPGVENVGTAGASAGQRGGANSIGSALLESAASADLRRLAQLAEAAAMLEEQAVTKGCDRGVGGSGGSGQDVGPGSHSNVPDEGGNRATGPAARLGADGADQAVLRQRAASLNAGVPVSGSGGALAGELRSTTSVPASFPALLRSVGSLPVPVPDGHLASAAVAGRDGGAGGSEREGSPGAGDDDGMVGTRRRSHMDSEAASEGGSQDGHQMEDDEDEGDGIMDGGDGSNDSAGGGSSAGGGGGRTLTERYRAALKASAKQRGRGHSIVKLDPDKPPRGSNRNGLCARIASITKERLQQVYHLNIEEAARELGIGMTKLKEHCRTLGIPRWPSRKLKSMDKLIESLNERATTEPATKEVIADILAEIESFKRAIYENPCLEVEEDIKRLRQSNFKKEYQQRQVEQRLRGGLAEKGSVGATGGGGGGSGRSTSVSSGVHLQNAGPSGGLSAASLATTPSGGTGAPLTPAVLSQHMLPAAALAVNLGPALGQLAAGAAAAQSSAQLVHALAQAQVQGQQLPGQVSLLAQGQLQQLLMVQPSGALQQLMAQRALGAMPPPALLLPAMLPSQLPKPVGPLAAVGEAAPNAE